MGASDWCCEKEYTIIIVVAINSAITNIRIPFGLCHLTVNTEPLLVLVDEPYIVETNGSKELLLQKMRSQKMRSHYKVPYAP